MSYFSSPVTKRGRDEEGQGSAKRTKTFTPSLSTSASGPSPSRLSQMGSDSRMALDNDDDSMGCDDEFEDDDDCTMAMPPRQDPDDFEREHPLQWRPNAKTSPAIQTEYDSYVPDEYHSATAQASAYPVQHSMFTVPSAYPAYPSSANPHPAFPTSYPTQSNPSSFTNMFTDSNGVTRAFAAEAPAQSMHVEESANQFAGYARSHGFEASQAQQYTPYCGA